MTTGKIQLEWQHYRITIDTYPNTSFVWSVKNGFVITFEMQFIFIEHRSIFKNVITTSRSIISHIIQEQRKNSFRRYGHDTT